MLELSTDNALDYLRNKSCSALNRLAWKHYQVAFQRRSPRRHIPADVHPQTISPQLRTAMPGSATWTASFVSRKSCKSYIRSYLS